MAVELATAYISLVPSFAGGQRAITSQLAGPIGKAGPQAGRSLGSGILSGVRRAAAVGGGLAVALGVRNLGRAVAESATGIQDTTATLTGLLGSASAARDTMERLRNVARTSPIDYQTYLSAGESLAYLGVQGEQAEGILQNIGAAITAAGGSSNQMDSVANSLLKMVNTGRVYAEDLNRISDAGVPIFSGLAAHFDTNIANVREMVQAGEVGINDVLDTIQNAEGDTFQSMLKASDLASKTFSNQWAIAKDNITTSLAQGIMPLLEGLTPVMTRFAAVAPGLVEAGIAGIAAAFQILAPFVQQFAANFRDTVLPVIVSVGQFVMNQLVPALVDLGSAVGAAVLPVLQQFGALMSGFVVPAVAALVSVVGTGLVSSLKAAAQWIRQNQALVRTITAAVLAGVVAYKAYRLAVIAINVVTRAWTALQRALNLVLRANPIGLVITALGALVGALVYAYNNSETFRNVVQAAWRGIQKVAQVVWAFLRDKVFAPWVRVFRGAREAAGTLRERTVGAFRGLRDGVLAVWQFIRDKIIAPIRRAFNNIVDWAKDVRKGVVGAFRGLRKSIGNIWDGITDAISGPVEKVIGWLNKYLINPLNAVTSKFGLDISPIGGGGGGGKVQGSLSFNKGGVVPGGGPNRDTVRAWLTPGEGILTRDTVNRLGGARAIHALNRGDDLNDHDAQGGAFDWVGNIASTVGGWLKKGLVFALDKVMGPVVSGVKNVVPGPPFVKDFYGGAMDKFRTALREWGESQESEAAGKMPGGTLPVGPNSATGLVLPSGSYRVGRGSAGHGYNARDLPAPIGTPIYAAAAGVIAKAARWTRSYGIHAAIDHGDWSTLYAHMSNMYVNVGDLVRRGQMIGRVGSTGNSTGPHLHLEPDIPRLYDSGGILPPGLTTVYNGTGRPERVLNPQQMKEYDRRSPDRFTATATIDLGDGIKKKIDLEFSKRDRQLNRTVKQRAGKR